MNLPGTPQHQALLRAIISHYADDPRILTVALFGSLARGTWDEHSDLDLDVVVIEDTHIDPIQELGALCDSFARIGEHPALIVPDEEDAGDVVLESLHEFSVRYHTLRTTSPNIVDSLLVLAGRLDRGTIQSAGEANRRADGDPPDRLLDRCVRYALGVHKSVRRGRTWTAVELLHRMRALLMQLFGLTHGGSRLERVFQAEAGGTLKDRLGATLPGYSPASIQRSLAAFLDLLERDLGDFTNGQLSLSAAQRKVLAQIRDDLSQA